MRGRDAVIVHFVASRTTGTTDTPSASSDRAECDACATRSADDVYLDRTRHDATVIVMAGLVPALSGTFATDGAVGLRILTLSTR